MRKFNVTGLCVPDTHYMADTSEKIAQIIQFVERREYFSINRGRQYGKTTTLFLLEEQLSEKYTVISISFEGVGDSMFETEAGFCQGFLWKLAQYYTERYLPGAELWTDESVVTFDLLDAFLNIACKDKKIVLMIDEVDKASNNVIFLKFLGILRDKYLKRAKKIGATFQSVILAGVYDIKNLKTKMILAGTHQLQDGEKRLNSPWNIAIDFNIDMSLSAKEISSMLVEYENDHKTGMNIEEIAQEIRDYTSGYPYLVSRICQYIENELGRDWTKNGVMSAVKEIILENSTLFDDLFKNIKSNPDLKELLRNLTVGKRNYPYNLDEDAIQLALTFGIVKEEGRFVAIHNQIFEVRITNYFISEKLAKSSDIITGSLIDMVTADDKFDMPLFLEKFAHHYYEIYNNKDINFLERECRLLFATYLKPYINGVGFYHLESETRNGEKTDVIIDYKTEQFIVELKLWYGEVAHEKAYDQLGKYLESKNKNTGFLVTFDFRKNDNIGKPQFKWVEHNGKKIFDIMIGI